MEQLQSKITGGKVEYLFNARVLHKYDVAYYKCIETGFIQTEQPYWLQEAYSSAITSLDLGLLSRNQRLVGICDAVIREAFEADSRFIDYAGGYGVFTRLMRDKGYDFQHQDPFCENLFAKLFDVTHSPIASKYELATAFEVFEHLSDPLSDIREILEYSDSILFSTELVPEGKAITSADDWWYLVPETGQHIAFYTMQSLQLIADRLQKNLYSNGKDVHLLTGKTLAKNPLHMFRGSLSVFEYAQAGLSLLDPRKLKAVLAHTATVAIPTRRSLLSDDFDLARMNCRDSGLADCIQPED